jgi:pimeloyl-ACP methyl ester carboxylesterase
VGVKVKLQTYYVKYYYFGTIGNPLFGSFDRPQRLRARSASVLLCNPFGEEAVRAHRIYRVIAGQLTRSGYPVLRFDYSGTGDSMGEADDATLEAWMTDVGSAAAELRQASGARRLVAFGLRLGGTLAALAAARQALRLRHLLLWDPVVDGAAYLRELATLHRDYMRVEMGTTGWEDRLRLSPEGFPEEALGAPVTPALRAELAALDLAAATLRADHVTVVATRTSPGLERLKARLASVAAARWIEITSTVPWNSDEGLNAAVVPMDIVQSLVARIEEVSP